jgi:hypothetical protein
MTMLQYTQPRPTRQRCAGNLRKISRIWVIALLVLAMGACLTSLAQAQDIAQSAVDKAGSFLGSKSRGEAIVGYLHLGTTYHGHKFLKTLSVADKRGHFDLVYRFRWSDDGITDLAFRCDARGYVSETYVVYTNAEWPWSQPFAAARATIRVLGNVVISSNKDMTPAERELAQRLVDAINVEGLMDLDLVLAQHSGK